MKKVIQCPCGSVIEGQNDEEVVKKAQEHAKATHGMDPLKGASAGNGAPGMKAHRLRQFGKDRSLKFE